MNTLVVVEDDQDIQFLIQTVFVMDGRFSFFGGAESAEEGIELARSSAPALIVLDHGLAGALTGLKAAPLLKEVAPQAKIILFTAHADLKAQADEEPAIDAFLLKTDIERLLDLAQELTGVGPAPDQPARP